MENHITKENSQKPLRVLAVHDLSAFGRCALTVIMPVLSAMGHQCIPLPTALLSTHTGGFDNMYFLDLCDSITPICDHFERLGLKFDAIYTGFLGSERQISIIASLIDRFAKEKTLVLVDPVMGDDGVLYSTYNENLVSGIRTLCKKAHIITPNLTEACFLTGLPCKDTKSMTPTELDDYISKLFLKISDIFDGRTVITGIINGENVLSAVSDKGKTSYCSCKYLPANYPGTGDIFASVLLGKMLDGATLSDAVRTASDFTAETVKYSIPLGGMVRDGVAFEKLLRTID